MDHARHAVVSALVCLGFTLLTGSTAWAGSVTADYSANHVNIHAQSQSLFLGATVTDSTPISGSATETETSAPPSFPHPPFLDSVAVSASMIPLGGGLPKDGMSGSPQLLFTNGTAGNNDTALFTFGAHGSAVNAKNSIGELAAGRQVEEEDLSFFVDSNFGPTPVPVGTTVGQFKLPPVRGALSGETIMATLFRDGVAVLAIPAGSPGGNVDLVAGHAYKLQLDYLLDVPHGVDPTTSFSYSVTLTPEPLGAFALLPLLGAIVRRPRRRSERTTRAGGPKPPQ